MSSFSILPATIFISIAFLTAFLNGCSSRVELKWHEETEYRWAEVSPGFFERTGFRELPPSKTNIDFINQLTEEEIIENRHYLNGSGVAAGDINGNGLIDLYFAGMNSPNRLYKNLGGMEFQDITEEAGVVHDGHYSTGVVFADINGNGSLDLLVASLYQGVTLYVNDGTGHFERDANSGLESTSHKGTHTLTLADINGNGYLDLYVTNYKEKLIEDVLESTELTWEKTVRQSYTEHGEVTYSLLPEFKDYYTIVYRDGEHPELRKIGEKDQLFLNNGNGKFHEILDTEKHFRDHEGKDLGLQRDWGLAAKFQDLNNNGLPDLYVANDFWTPDRLWINQGNGTFNAADPNIVRNHSFSAMAVDFSDINRNGSIDFFITEMLSPDYKRRLRLYSPPGPHSSHRFQIDKQPLYNRNSLYLNRGDNTYAEITSYSGLEASDWSWALRFMDVNLDGFEDIIINTGFSYDLQDLDAILEMHRGINQGVHTSLGYIVNYPSLELPNKFFRNNGDLTFSDVSENWGFTTKDISQGLALADLNQNGTLDLVINRLNQYPGIYENRTTAPRIAVRLSGAAPNTQGIGAKVELRGGPVDQQKELSAGGDYLSGSDPVVVFAADKNNSNHKIIVTWPNGRQSIIDNVEANRIYDIRELDSTEIIAATDCDSSNISPLFEDVSQRISHHHSETPYDDFQLQPLLPLMQNRQGPGVSWIDYNQNGYDDLFISSGKGGELALFENLKNGGFNSVNMEPLTDEAPGDQTTILGWTEHDNTRIIVGSANYKQGNPNVPSAFIYSIDRNGSVSQDEIPGILSTTGPLAAADVNGNGYLDLFIGGRFKPGQYPRDADSRLFINENGTFRLDEVNSQIFSELGLVTGAVFADFNQNGKPDLLVSTEWGSLRLFENNDGVFQEITQDAGLDHFHGWWNGVATGDFTNNGLPDIVATNMGLNSSYQIENGHPLRMFYEDINWDGTLNIIEAQYHNKSGAYIPRRKLHDFESIPMILQYVQTHEQFADATLDKIFNRDFSEVPFKELNTLEHMIFINTGEGFKAHPLPPEAQFTAAFHAGVADFDNDGNEDLFLSQNFFSFSENTPRLDAGRGLILKGDGKGSFIPTSGNHSGILVYGEQRGAALSDFTREGMVDLAVSQTNEETKLYLNQSGTPGLRIQLIGPDSNRDAFGSSIRIVYTDESKGPRREIQAGSGYWSQNSKVQVMGTSKYPDKIEVKWFDGSTDVIEISEESDEIIITYN